FGFPNKNSFPGFINKLNWEHYSYLHTYVIKSGALPFDKLFKKFNRFSYLYENYAKRKLKNWIVADLPENSLKANALGLGFVVHDVTFYSYKEYSTSFVLNVDGVKCNVKIDGRLWIGDLSICTESKFSETVSKLIEIARSISCSSIHFCAFKGSFLDCV